MRWGAGASQRLLLRPTIVNAKEAGETTELFFEPAGRVGSLQASESLRMSRLSGGDKRSAQTQATPVWMLLLSGQLRLTFANFVR